MERINSSPEKYSNVVTTSSNDLRKSVSPFANKELKKSLETIVLNSNSKKGLSVLEHMLSDKTRTLKASVNALLEEIGLREKLNACHFKKIDNEVSRLHSELINLENICESSPGDLTGILSEERARIKADVLELERERRSEGLEC